MNATGLPRQDDLAALRVLEEIERKPDSTQREISRSVGVSLGLTNLLIKKMAKKAWIKIKSVPGRRVLYALTPKGIAEKIRKTRDFVRLSFRYYADMRNMLIDRIRASGIPQPRVADVGAGELGEIVAEAARKVDGVYLGSFAESHDPNLVVFFATPEESLKRRLKKEKIETIDLS